MSIRIVEDGPEIVLTRSQYERLKREWEETQKYTTAPSSFESWLRRQPKSIDAVGVDGCKATIEMIKP